MDWNKYKKSFKISAKSKGLTDKQILSCLNYAKKLHDQELPIIYDAEHLSRLLGYTVEYLYHISNNQLKSYRVFKVVKRNGSFREIAEPCYDLKQIQSWILNNILLAISPSRYAKAYRKGFSIKDNVRFHINQPVVIKMDIKDFFPSIHLSFVIGLFFRLGYSKQLSYLMARLCCFKDCLPQGAPTSPCISNIYCNAVDKRIGGYVIKAGFRYTRYSDDITISGNISKKQVNSVISFCKTCIEDAKLQLNKEKTQVISSHKRQVVTGVVLNRKISAGTSYKKKVRQQMHYINKYGIESHLLYSKIDKRKYLYHLSGQINWVLFLEKDNEEFQNYKAEIRKIILSK